MKHKKHAKKKISWQVVLILLAIPFTVLLTQFQQNIRSSAQTVFSSPPMFFCLAVGESNKDQCASSTLEAETTLQLNGYDLNRDKTVYYNDTLTGTATYTNTGDVPVVIKKITLAAESKKGDKRVEFNPSRQNVTVQPGKTVTVTGTSRFFESPDPGGVWEVFSTVTLADGKALDNKDKNIINVSTACTGLRAIPLSDGDTGTLKAFCSNNQTNKLCTSRQYCELTGGRSCKQTAPQQEYLDKQLQCDDYIIIPEKEQELLEEFCKEYPNATTCKDYCNRTIGSPICPDPNVVANAPTAMVAGAKIAKANASCRSGVSNYIGECCAGTSTYKSAAGNELCGSAPGGGAAPAPAAPAPVKNAPQCNSGIANNVGQCCAVGTCVVNGLCSRTCGGAGGGATQPRACASGTKNSIGQCCKYSGALAAGGRCPTGAGGAPITRIVPNNGAPARTCAIGSVRNSVGVCVPAGGTGRQGNGVQPLPAGPSQRQLDCKSLETTKWNQCLDRCAGSTSCRAECTSGANSRIAACNLL